MRANVPSSLYPYILFFILPILVILAILFLFYPAYPVLSWQYCSCFILSILFLPFGGKFKLAKKCGFL